MDMNYSTETGFVYGVTNGEGTPEYIVGHYVSSYDEKYGGIHMIKVESYGLDGTDGNLVFYGTRYYTVKVKDEWTSEEGETITSTEQNAYTNGINGGFKYIYQGLK